MHILVGPNAESIDAVRDHGGPIFVLKLHARLPILGTRWQESSAFIST